MEITSGSTHPPYPQSIFDMTIGSLFLSTGTVLVTRVIPLGIASVASIVSGLWMNWATDSCLTKDSSDAKFYISFVSGCLMGGLVLTGLARSAVPLWISGIVGLGCTVWISTLDSWAEKKCPEKTKYFVSAMAGSLVAGLTLALLRPKASLMECLGKGAVMTGVALGVVYALAWLFVKLLFLWLSCMYNVLCLICCCSDGEDD